MSRTTRRILVGAALTVVFAAIGADAVASGDDSESFVVEVADTTTALQDLARWVRRESAATVVAITGSTGKTTTKDTIAEFVGTKFRVVKNTGNLNNHLGLPLSLLELRHGADVAVMELGMNHAGEIRTLVGVATPVLMSNVTWRCPDRPFFVSTMTTPLFARAP